MENTEILGSYVQPERPLPAREYKDRLFKAVFGRDTEQSRHWRLDLYNALNGTSYTDPNALTMTTIENVIYITMKNDISFLIGSQMNLFEQQSSYNPNMPLRGLLYFAQLYQMNLSQRGLDLLGSTLVKIPSPSFIVFYNGDRELPDVSDMKLSDAFEPKGSAAGFEWTARVINIGWNHSQGLQKKCRSLYDYCRYVDRVKGNLKAGLPIREAVGEALNYAIKKNLLEDFFKVQKYEVLNMSLTEFDQEEYDRNRRREGWEEGRVEGREEGLKEGREEGLKDGRVTMCAELIQSGLLSIKDAAMKLGMPEEELKKHL